jgi:mannuronan 5-epimerase
MVTMLVVAAFVLLTPLSYTDNSAAVAASSKKDDTESTRGVDTSSSSSSSTSSSSQNSASSCIRLDSNESVITITCKNVVRLTDIDKQLKNSEVLQKETRGSRGAAAASAKVWLLNAGLRIEKGSTLIIDSKDTKWLKIIADGTAAHGIIVHGSLKIDSVKVTSWNPNTNNYATTENSKRVGKETVAGNPRPYISVEKDATGTTDITNSEIAYLGYEGGFGAGRTGIRYDGGNNSRIQGNDIHDLWFGFYSVRVDGIVIENNQIHHNGFYGVDPHTGTHDMVIRNNTVHDNGSTAIICSLDCHSIIIEGNTVYNGKSGIAFTRNVRDSVANNNHVYDMTRCISVSASHNNEVHSNTVSNCDNGIYLLAGSSNNKIHDNKVRDSVKGILVNTNATDNTISANTITNATEDGISVDPTAGDNSILDDNNIKHPDKDMQDDG